MTELESVLAKVRKLLALAEGGCSEHETMSAMAQVHRLLALHHLSLAEVRASAAAQPIERAVDATQFDGLADRWTLNIWHATASLFFCRYFYTEEMGTDRAGRRRPVRLRHSIVGTPANQVTAKVMADHFCRTVRRLARAYAAEGGGGQPARRSFESGCADRLRDRIWARRTQTAKRGERGSRLPALLGLYEQEAAANEAALAALGIKVGQGRVTPRKPADVLAEHVGRESAETISLALQIGGGTVAATGRPAEATQMGFGF